MYEMNAFSKIYKYLLFVPNKYLLTPVYLKTKIKQQKNHLFTDGFYALLFLAFYLFVVSANIIATRYYWIKFKSQKKRAYLYIKDNAQIIKNVTIFIAVIKLLVFIYFLIVVLVIVKM